VVGKGEFFGEEFPVFWPLKKLGKLSIFTPLPADTSPLPYTTAQS
jgi:hypothetical protein